MKNKIRIGIDIDGVLRDFSGQLYNYMSDNYPESIMKDCIDDWDFQNCFKGWDKKALQELYWEKYPDYFFGSASPLRGAIPQMWDLFEWGRKKIRFVCISAQRTPGTYASLKWLGSHALSFREIHFIRGSEKWKKDVEFLVDDSPTNYNAWIQGRGNDDGYILMDAPYNQHIKSKHRIYELKEVKDIIRESYPDANL